MAEARSYARPGQFSNRIQAPQTAKAKRQRDLEMVAELKEENQALKERDAEFLGKYIEKLQKEEAARADVENARRYSVESERKQREANFNLAADFAQQEQNARNKVLEAFGDMLPTVGEAIAEEGVRRREAELEAKEAAWSRLDPTPEELREWRSVEDTSLFESGTKYAELRQRLEANNITVDQFVKGLHLRGIDGVAASIVDVRRRVQSIPSILAKEIQEGTTYGKNNVPIGDLVNSTNVPGNDRSGLNDFTRKIHDYVYEGLNPVFVQKYVGEDLGLALANIRNTSDKNKQKQAQQIYDEKVYTETVGIASTPDSLHSTINGRAKAYGGGERGRYQALKEIFFDIQGEIEAGQVPDNVISNISNTQIFDLVQNKMVPAIEHSWLGPRIRDSLTKRRQRENAEFNSRQAFQNAQEQREVLEHRQYLMDNDLTIEQQEAWLQGLTNDPNPHVRIWAQKMLNSSITAQENYRQEQVLDHLNEKAAAGIPFTKEYVMGLGLGGRNLNAALKLAGQNTARAEYFKEADSDFNLALKQRRSDIPNTTHNHEQHNSVLRRMNADYRRKYDELKKWQGTSGKTDEEIHEEAKKTVLEQFKDGTGVYEYLPRADNPNDMHWPRIGQGQPDGEQPSLSITDAVKAHKLGFYNKPNTIFRQSELARMRTVQDITPVDWAQAREAAQQAKLQGDIDVTKEQVIIAQLEAANLPVPAKLREIRDTQEKILNEVPEFRRALDRPIGERPYDISLGHSIMSNPYPDKEGFDSTVTNSNKYFFPLPATVLKVVTGQDEMFDLNKPGETRSGYGNYVELRVAMPNGRQFDVLLAHFGNVNNLQKGQSIPAGSYIGDQGRTGSTTGVHVSFDFFYPGTAQYYPEAARYFETLIRHGVTSYIPNSVKVHIRNQANGTVPDPVSDLVGGLIGALELPS